MVQRVATVAFEGIEARAVDVQVQAAPGLPAFNVVGLPDKAVSEARERVRAALVASGLALPARRITVNLAPADLPKEGSHYDLPIALGLMGLAPFPLTRSPALPFWANSASTARLQRSRACCPPRSEPTRAAKASFVPPLAGLRLPGRARTWRSPRPLHSFSSQTISAAPRCSCAHSRRFATLPSMRSISRTSRVR